MTILKAKKCEVINTRVPTYLKDDSRVVLDSIGLDHSKVIRSLLEYVIKHKRVPDGLELK